MMKKVIFVVAVLIVVLVGNWAQGDVCEIVNGSFEDDGIISDITVQSPNGWDDVNLPAGLFAGNVGTRGVTDANYSLTIYLERYKVFEVNDIATVSQEVCFTDANAIIFDLSLEKYAFPDWDPNKCTAVLLIDDAVVWESNSVGPDVAGEYRDQIYVIDGAYKDGGMHKLSVGLRVNIAGKLDDLFPDFFFTHWDFIRFGELPPCDGHGYLPEDFSEDCYVDFFDFAILANYWLDEPPPEIDLDLVEDGQINEYDLMEFVKRWLGSSYD